MGVSTYSESVARWTFSILVALAILVWFFSVSAYAQELELVKGKGVCVCEAHLKNLNTMVYWYRMICERDEHYPEKNNITRPKWTELDLRENLELTYMILKFLAYGVQFMPYTNINDDVRFKRNFEGNWSRTDSMYVADVDIANTGKAEKLLLYSLGNCMNRVYSKSLLVVNSDKTQLDLDKTKPLLQNSARNIGDVKTQAIEHLYMLYDVFFYKGVTFFDKWDVNDWTLTVYKTTDNSTSEICKYKFSEESSNSGVDDDTGKFLSY